MKRETRLQRIEKRLQFVDDRGRNHYVSHLELVERVRQIEAGHLLQGSRIELTWPPVRVPGRGRILRAIRAVASTRPVRALAGWIAS